MGLANFFPQKVHIPQHGNLYVNLVHYSGIYLRVELYLYSFLLSFLLARNHGKKEREGLTKKVKEFIRNGGVILMPSLRSFVTHSSPAINVEELRKLPKNPLP